jgi:serine/threonine protein phosphatase PrpC
LLFLGDEEQCDRDFPQGSVSVRSRRSPEKSTPNEDAAVVIPVGRHGLVLAVADGVGGTPAGREASHIAVRALGDALNADDIETDRLRPPILDAFENANRQIMALGRGAATTLVIGEVVAQRLRSYHVGDSELISVGQRGRVKSRVVPHSPTGFAVEAGLLDENEAVSHDQRHILFNVIGAPDMRVEIGTAHKLAVRDTVLLASDGLLDNVFVGEIIEIMRKGPLPAAADALLAMASARMSDRGSSQPSKPDDLTIVLYRTHAPKRKQRAAE